MATKRALIVDDSKSARFALKRMLKELNLDVDTAESANDALEYLESHQPDVIFMDHMMPGMDGFEAVKRIKNNPDTVFIPIMMYTSKGGDLYLSQARALGAVGIIPKTIAPVELKESLLELGIIDSIPVTSTIKTDESVTSESYKEATSEKPVSKGNALDIYIEDLRKLMDDQTIELHRSMWLGIESVSHEIFNRLNTELEEKLNRIKSTPEEQPYGQAYKNKGLWPIYLVSTLLILSVIFNIVLLFDNDKPEDKLKTVSDRPIAAYQDKEAVKETAVTTQRTRRNKNARREFIVWAQNKTIEYPYNEMALNDERLPDIEELIQRAMKAEYTGEIILQTHAGEFCLSSNIFGNYVLADNDSSIADCEYMGNYTQPNDNPSAHQSLGFANYFADTSSLNKNGIRLEVATLSRKRELSKYPERLSQTTAEIWNNAAQLNNIITVKLRPASDDSLMGEL